MKAYLVLEDGSIYTGQARGAFRETVCEIVFNTAMTGYVEELTDPSYAGLGIVMTYPMVGNYGVSLEDFESERLQPKAVLMHELCDTPSNFRSTGTLDELLKQHGIPCLTGLDTRAIVKRLRENGTMRGMLTEDISNMDRCQEAIRAFQQQGLVESVTSKKEKMLGQDNPGPSIALLDFGTKYNIANSLLVRGCRVTQYPSVTTAKEIIAAGHDGLLLSNGPGNPEDCPGVIREVKELYDYGIPTHAICLGHQLMALAVGGSTERMKYGHRGANHPVKFLDLDRTFLSSQNHGYVVCKEGLPKNAQVNCINVNDGTVEGIAYDGKPVFTVQFHPEASPGPTDTGFLFDRFLEMVANGRVAIHV